jgi:ubiquinone/menaquinone biosynthesis C-methylase UbiE
VSDEATPRRGRRTASSPPDSRAAAERIAGAPRRFFDVWSYVYDFPMLQRLTYRPVHDAVLRALRRRAPESVLDLGCGTGQLLGRIAGELSPDRLAGCDYSSGMLAHAAERFRDPAALPIRHGGTAPALVRGDALRLPFAAGAFDAVVSTEAFHWFPDQDAALAEITRVLRRDGTLLLGFVNPPLALIGDVFRLGSSLLGAPLGWPTPAALRRRVEAAGLSVVSQRRIFRVPGFLLPPVLTEARRL